MLLQHFHSLQRPLYSFMLDRCVGCSKMAASKTQKHFDVIGQLVREIEDKPFRDQLPFISTLLEAYSRGNMLAQQNEEFQNLPKFHLKPNAFTFKCLLQSHARAGEIDRSIGKIDETCRVFHEKSKRGCPDVYSYTIIIRILSKAGKLEVAREIFEHMLHTGCTPNVITYNTLIELVIPGLWS